jgi:CDP-paratose 2-epimerase
MEIVLVTGAAGLIGAACVRLFSTRGLTPVGIDNDMRAYFFGPEASTRWSSDRLREEIDGYRHHDSDIRDREELEQIFRQYGSDIKAIIHTAAQPSHDWAAKEPFTDFDVNATGTLNLLEMTRRHCPEAVFIFSSTNKVYGDSPNRIEFIEHETRWEPPEDHCYFRSGIDENLSIDSTTHSLFGASKAAADLMVQEYGRYFGLKTSVFRGGCLTGPGHSAAMLHGFLAYLMKCAITGDHYEILGYKGKQVRDNIHSHDLAECFYQFYLAPRCGEVYNIGGSRHANCSILEAIANCERIAGRKFNRSYRDAPRVGDHIWWISDVSKFRSHYPAWEYTYDLDRMLVEIHHEMGLRLGN